MKPTREQIEADLQAYKPEDAKAFYLVPRNGRIDCACPDCGDRSIIARDVKRVCEMCGSTDLYTWETVKVIHE